MRCGVALAVLCKGITGFSFALFFLTSNIQVVVELTYCSRVMSLFIRALWGPLVSRLVVGLIAELISGTGVFARFAIWLLIVNVHIAVTRGYVQASNSRPAHQ